MHAHSDLTPEHASRLAVTALVADLEYWARSVAVDGHLAVVDLIRTLDLVRDTTVPDPVPSYEHTAS
ncbi:hypothetical protein [Pseudonocardia sp. GCM10023141]|uniref:hypothetical protein n=1 Tax=Pseudonocardia sp. GCM10023141 TaxID=3252653 RepID=UPI0036219639